MFGIGGFNPVSLLATSMLGPVGGIVAQLASQLMSQIGQQVIQNLGQNMGLPQSVIDMAQGSFAGRYGDVQGQAQNLDEAIAAFGNEMNASPQQTGEAQRQFQDAIDDIVRDLSDSQEAKEAKATGGKGGGGWLRAMAEVLGAKLDDLAHEMEDLAGRVTKEDPSTTTDFSVVSNQFNMLMNATSTAIKTVGEAMAGAARKQ
jgi:hypothetical protein